LKAKRKTLERVFSWALWVLNFLEVVPKGWCTIKVSSYTPNGGSEVCPIPSGWKDQGKQKTIRDADGRIIL